MRSSSIAVVGGIALVSAAVAPASGGRHAALPATGLAVQTRAGVELVDLGGRLERSLPGYRLRFVGVERLGQVELRAPGGRSYELRHGRLEPAPANTVTLPFGYTLRFERSRWVLARGDAVVQRFPRGTHVELDDSGSVLTSMEGGTSAARGLSTGERENLPRACRVGVQRRGVRFELCGYPYAKAQPSTIVRVTTGGRRLLAGPAERAGQRPAGLWEHISLSPDGTKLLAQWSSQCEIPVAYLIDAASGRLTALGRTQTGSIPEGRTIGWSGSSALVSLPLGACGGTAGSLGVYAIRGGRARLVYALPRDRRVDVRLWR